ncbi:hypothetical protein BN946_scf184994.g33 [Trametes cinnabarina]|uniref:Uncharacterized protein n=1 Tax=Pycnoporus cinnabarinus TaxID=5643 RepID=A0A060SEJ3_PYCCI|nr:hypothetical protein BN946_scf184994.g33 [Trametes cinnabarina]
MGAEPPVHHLFLSFLPDLQCDAPLRNWRKWTDYARTEAGRIRQFTEDTHTWLIAKTDWNRRFILHVSRLFVLAGPSLRTLTVLQAREVRLPLVRYHFPVLRELMLLGDDCLFVRMPPPGIHLPCENDPSDFEFYGVPLPSADGPNGAPFPSLGLLHIVFMFPKLHPWEQTLRQWAILTPAITHIHISQGNTEVLKILCDMFGLGTIALRPDGQRIDLKLMESWHRSFVRMSRNAGMGGPMAPQVLALKEEIEEASMKPEWKGRALADLRIALQPARSYREKYWPSRLQRDWEDRMRGGSGGWRECEEEDADLGVARALPTLGGRLLDMLAHPIDKLHGDIWYAILKYACTDGGQTAAALALTSSTMRTASAPHRFHSLKLTSLAQIGRLLLSVDRIERSRRPSHTARTDDGHSVLNAQHLLLSFFPENCESLVMEDEQAWETAKGAWDRQFVYLASRLFHLVAPTLQSLAMLQHPDIALPQLNIAFPVLWEVSLPADDAVLIRPEPQWTNEPRHAERGDCNTRRAPCFPSLTHLHVLYEGSKQVSNIIPGALEGTPMKAFQHTRVTVEARTILLHSSLRKVIIQPLVLQPVSGYEHLEEVSIQSQAPRGRGDAKIVVLQGRWYRDGYWRDQLRWEWEDRLVDRPGCWGEREEDKGEWMHECKKRAEVTTQKTKMKKLTMGRDKDLIKLDGHELAS